MALPGLVFWRVSVEMGGLSMKGERRICGC